MDFPDDKTIPESAGRYFEGRKVFGGRFVLKRKLGQGGMGQVWLALDTELAIEVALKFTAPEFAGDTKAEADLRRAVTLGRELTHPGIVRVYDFHSDDRECAISMEYMPGKNLYEWQAETPNGFFEVEEIQDILAKVCEVLDYAHQVAKRSHRDIKPKNIMLDATTGTVKIADFDIGRRLTDTYTRNTGKESSGSLPYMGPQQLLGENSRVQDDVYSLGVTIYELLTSTQPFWTGDVRSQIPTVIPTSMVQRRRDLLEQGNIPALGDSIPASWEHAVAASLAKSREDRPASAGALLAMLQAGNQDTVVKDGNILPKNPMTGAPVAQAPKSTVHGTRSSLSQKKRKNATVTWAVAACVVLGLTALAVIQMGRNSGRSSSPSGLAENTAQQTVRVPEEPRQQTEASEKQAEEIRQQDLAAQTLADEDTQKRKQIDETKRKAEVAAEKAKKELVYAATKDQPFENSLEMRFVPVPIADAKSAARKVLFSIWETRRRDYEAYSEAFGKVDGGWKNAEYEGVPVGRNQDEPVVNISEKDAESFCEWLTRLEINNGKISSESFYRLPTDHEWSCAVGIGEEEDADLPPSAKFQLKINDIYPWGEGWTPVGNYADESYSRKFKSNLSIVKYSDGYATTAAVGQFTSNKFGIYDMGGNVCEWTSTGWTSNDNAGEGCAIRGSSWQDQIPIMILSSARRNWLRKNGIIYTGFRCVLDVPGS